MTFKQSSQEGFLGGQSKEKGIARRKKKKKKKKSTTFGRTAKEKNHKDAEYQKELCKLLKVQEKTSFGVHSEGYVGDLEN